MELNDAVIPGAGVAPEPTSFILACAKFFGRRASQSLKEFNDELKALTPADRFDLKQMLESIGFTITNA